jgi:hypothetical protein
MLQQQIKDKEIQNQNKEKEATFLKNGFWFECKENGTYSKTQKSGRRRVTAAACAQCSGMKKA